MSIRKIFALTLFAAIAVSSAALAQGGGGAGGAAGTGGAGTTGGATTGGATLSGAGTTGGATTGGSALSGGTLGGGTLGGGTLGGGTLGGGAADSFPIPPAITLVGLFWVSPLGLLDVLISPITPRLWAICSIRSSPVGGAGRLGQAGLMVLTMRHRGGQPEISHQRGALSHGGASYGARRVQEKAPPGGGAKSAITWNGARRRGLRKRQQARRLNTDPRSWLHSARPRMVTVPPNAASRRAASAAHPQAGPRPQRLLLATWFSSEGELRASEAVAQLGISQTGRSMMRALAILTVLPLVLTAPALAQNAQQQPTSPNSGAGIAGQPGSKSGPAAKSPSATTGSGVGESRNQDAAKVPGLPGSKSGPAAKPPSSSAPTPK